MKNSIFVFHEIFTSTDKNLILRGGLSTKQLFYKVLSCLAIVRQLVYTCLLLIIILHLSCALSEVSKYGITSGPYFPVFSPNTGKYGREITPYLDTFHAVVVKGTFA